MPILSLIGASGVAGIACWLTTWSYEVLWGSQELLRQLLQLSLAGSLGLRVFAVLVSFMKIPEVELLVQRFKKKGN
ncbi:hypothetical protein SD80_016465 [Scytonema tolypothrichoides VB-61278]|nr:hypothetical protein SD80_016465 [Scytonema tolypothrichoides VB-61278]